MILKFRFALSVVLIGLNMASLRAESMEKLLGMPFNSLEVQELMSSVKGDAVESFVPFRRSYKLTYKAAGIELEFNSDLSLYQIKLYDSGYSFQSFRAALPFDAQWGCDSNYIQNRHGIMEAQAQNPYIKSYRTQDYSALFYFRNGRLEQMRLIATTSLLLAKSEQSLKSWGLRLMPDGKAVEGNVIEGEGVMVWGQRAARYEGEWSYGLPHGVGVYIDSFGNEYAGEFKLGFFWGSGSYTSKYYGFSYNGYFVMGKRHGQGVIKYSNGTGYNGDWFQDAMHGTGQYHLGDEHYYQGEMRFNTFYGKGTLTTPEGFIKGKFKKGKPHGYCEQYAIQSQQTLSGYWVDGKKEGEFTLNAFGFDKKVYFKNDLEVFPEEDH